MELKKINKKKGVMSEIVSVFILLLVISVLAGLTFLFTAELKDQISTNSRETVSLLNSTTDSVVNDTSSVFIGGGASSRISCSATVTLVTNASEGTVITAGNYTVSGCKIIFSEGSETYNNDSLWNITGSYNAEQVIPFRAINDTEASGSRIINFLPLVFFTLIFGAILTLVLKIILPFLNLGNRINSF